MRFKLAKLHKYLGLIMILPFIAWAVTGVFFFIKPGYQNAYESLPIKSYQLSMLPVINVAEEWQEIRWLRSILGLHLLIKTNGKWQQLDTNTLQVIKPPSDEDIKRLIDDATKKNIERYGKIISIEELNIITNTDITISLNWDQMTLYQKGTDTDFIDTMYKIHYLQWTGFKSVDRFLGLVGLALVVLLACVGVYMTLNRRRL